MSSLWFLEVELYELILELLISCIHKPQGLPSVL